MSLPTASDLPSLPAQAAPPSEMPHLDKVRSGYHPAQVHQYITSLLGRIHELETELAHGVGKLGHGVLRDLGSPKGQVLIGDLMKLAMDEIQGKQSAAAAEVAAMLKNAAEDVKAQHEQAARQASNTLTSADQQASALVSGAQEQADTVLQTAHGQAKDIVDRASAHAAAVHEGAERRARAASDFHQETLRRLREIHQVSGTVLQADTERGTLDDEIARALSPGQPAEGEIPLPSHVDPVLHEAGPEPEGEEDRRQAAKTGRVKDEAEQA